MKKYMILSLFFILLAAAVSVSADSVWMPVDDFFYETWQPESEATCEYQKRQIFMAAGQDGYVTAVRTPLDQVPLANYPNGTEFMMNFICGIGDNKWGTIRSYRLPGEKVFTEDYTGQSGYITAKDLVYAYDTYAFTGTNFNSIFGYTEPYFDPCRPMFPFVIWSYPNSGVQLDVVTEGTLDWFCHEYEPGSQYFPIKADRVYREADGTEWLSVILEKPYTYGWINMAHPMEGAVIQNFE